MAFVHALHQVEKAVKKADQLKTSGTITVQEG